MKNLINKLHLFWLDLEDLITFPPVIFLILVTTLLTVAHVKENKYDNLIGTEVVIQNDTLTITNYSSGTFSLSNGAQYDKTYLLELK